MFVKRASKKAGLAPGTLMYLGEKREAKVKIKVMDYGPDYLEEKELSSVDECLSYQRTDTVSWINITGIHDMETIRALGEEFKLHPLLLEDVVNTEQRPKIDDFEDYLFIVMKMIYSARYEHSVAHEQISLILMPKMVLTLQEFEEDFFEPLRERIRRGKGRIRSGGTDYLTYALIDITVDNYFHLLEETGEQIEILQEKILSEPTPLILAEVQDLKREMIYLRKSVWPLREIVNSLIREEFRLVRKDVNLYFRDVYDHTIQIIDNIETYRDMLSSMMDIYLSSVSNKMNEIMKVLTTIATIFIPMTFLAGLYGMNFKYMPELEIKWAYPAFWVVIIIIFIMMVVWFKRKKWL
jgi:magnesium transporter